MGLVETGVNDAATQEILSAIGNKENKKKKEKQFGNVTVEYRTDGEKIILPEGMSNATARAWLEKIEKAEETVVNFHAEMKAYPSDGAYALLRAMQEKFGFADMVAEKGASGDTPPTMISLKLPDGTMANVPWGRLSFPGLDAKSYLETKYDNTKMLFIVAGQIKRKYQKIVDQLMLLTEQILKTDSIYKGNAIRVDLSFLDTAGAGFAQPEFLNDSVKSIKEEDVLLDDVTRLNYAAVLLRITKTNECRTKGIQIKHGCLLAGPYGTGKTLLAKYTAKVGIENKWTFIYLEDAKQLKHALRLAEMYAPCVVFTEDIDKAVEGGRSTEMNAILNTLDGIDTKSNPIITVLTTNHLENINKAFLRAGRIDSLVEMKPLNSVTGAQFLQRFASDRSGNSLLTSDMDYSEAASSLTGIVPAFASEVVNKAKMYAMYNNRELLVPTDITTASDSFKEHIRLTTENIQPTEEQIIARAVKTVNSYGTGIQDFTDVRDNVANMKKNMDKNFGKV
jgi:transitional endoplasmic reticulum ATPase